MPESEVLYADVKFASGKRKAREAVFSSTDTTYSEVKILKLQPLRTEPPEGSQQAVLSRTSKVTLERVALLVLSALLAAAVIALIVTGRFSKTKPCSTMLSMCPKCSEVKDEPCSKCEKGWEQHGGKCYYFSNSKLTWNGSRDQCIAKGGDLVKIDRKEEQIYLDQKLGDIMEEGEDKFWIGLTDSAKEDRWLWVDGVQLDNSLTYWSKDEPDNWNGANGGYPEGEDCARMGERGGTHDLRCWFDAHCMKLHRSICEKPLTLLCSGNSVQSVK